MTPYLRYAAAVLLALVLFIASIRGAHAAEPDPDCLSALGPYAAAVHQRHVRGVPPELNALLIRSDPDLAGQGRWALLQFLDVIAARPDIAPDDVITFLCSLSNIPTAAPTYRSEFDRPKDI